MNLLRAFQMIQINRSHIRAETSWIVQLPHWRRSVSPGRIFWRGVRNDAMSNQSNSRTNRREILALTLGAAALLSLLETPAYAAKVSKASVRYQDSPKGGSECSNCKLFVPPNACKNVAGEISPKGWCALWVKV